MDTFLITCEHGGNRIPGAYRALFRGCEAQLDSHRGFDAGALILASALATALRAPLVTSTVSRLLVDLNRSIGHPQLFSVMTRDAPIAVRHEIVKRHYNPYRARVEECVNRSVSQGRRVVHISSHSFTGELDGEVRQADVGLLYDPERSGEAALCTTWEASLAGRAPSLEVRRNYPYEGKDDGLPSYLRSRFPDEAYLGIELEVNQDIVLAAGPPWKALRSVLIDSLHTALGRSR